MKVIDYTAPVAALRDELTVNVAGRNQDRVRIAVGMEGEGEDFSLTLDAEAALRHAHQVITAAYNALGYPGSFTVVAIPTQPGDG